MSEPRPAETGPADRLMRVATAIAIGALLAPCVAAAAASIALPVLDATPIGDETPFEARILTLTDPPALVGPYSRHGWHHPGPLAFWLFGIPYRLLGGAPVVLHLAVAALNAACIVALLRSTRVLAPGPVARAIALTGIALLVLTVSSVYAPSGLAALWNPIFTLLPFCALVLLCVELAEGSVRAALPAVLLHAFVTQSHVAYVPLASVPLALAVGLAIRGRRADGSRVGGARAGARRADQGRADDRRAWIAAAAALALAWSPVIADTWLGSGNLWDIARYFTSSPRTEFPLSLTGAITLFAVRATAPLGALLHDDADRIEGASPWALGLALSLTAIVVAGVIAGAVRHRGGERRAIGTLCLFCALQLAVGFFALLRIDAPTQVYLTWWLSVLGVLSAMAAALAHAPRPAPGTRAGRLALAAGSVAVIALVGRAGLVMREVIPDRVRRAEEDRAAIEPLLPGLTRAYACHPRAPLAIAEHDLWGVLGAVLVRLEQSGVSPGIDPAWEFMFGPGFPATSGSPSFLLGARVEPSCEPIARSPWLVAMMCDAPVPALAAAPLALAIADARGVTGELDRLLDGHAAPEGRPWDADGAIVLADTDAQVTLALPSARLSRVVVTGDGNDALALDGSADGRAFERLAEIADLELPGQRTREIVLDPPRVLRTIRIAPLRGDGWYSLSAVRAEGTPALRVLAAQGAEGDLSRLTDGVAPAEGTVWNDPAAVVLAPGPRSITAALPATSVAGLVLSADHDESWRIEGSSDGVDFVELGTIDPTPRPGLVTRRFRFDGTTLYSHVRLTALGGDGATSIAELDILPGRGTVIDVGTPGARVHLLEGWSIDEGEADATWAWAVGHESVVSLPRPRAASELLVSVGAFGALPRSQVLTIRAEGTVRAFPLGPGVQTVRVELPATEGSGDLVVHLLHAHAASPRELGLSDDPRSLASAVHRIELRPDFDPCEHE